MADELPGFIPHVLRLDDVSLLRADETVFNAMVDGWRAQMLARGLAVDTIKARCRLVSRMVEFTLTSSRGGGARLILISFWRI